MKGATLVKHTPLEQGKQDGIDIGAIRHAAQLTQLMLNIADGIQLQLNNEVAEVIGCLKSQFSHTQRYQKPSLKQMYQETKLSLTK